MKDLSVAWLEIPPVAVVSSTTLFLSSVPATPSVAPVAALRPTTLRPTTSNRKEKMEWIANRLFGGSQSPAPLDDNSAASLDDDDQHSSSSSSGEAATARDNPQVTFEVASASAGEESNGDYSEGGTYGGNYSKSVGGSLLGSAGFLTQPQEYGKVDIDNSDDESESDEGVQRENAQTSPMQKQAIGVDSNMKSSVSTSSKPASTQTTLCSPELDPLSYPSPVKFSQMENDNSISGAGIAINTINLSKEGTATSDVPSAKEVTFSPAKDVESTVITTTDYSNNTQQQLKEEQQKVIHRMDTKLKAIYRALLHLSDNSYSFVYESNNDNCNNTNNSTDDGSAHDGLPFIGPGIKEQYTDLRGLLRRGLLGYDDEEVANDTKISSGEDSSNLSNLIRPKIKSNVSAVLMGPRGHGKSLVLERCLADLSRLAGKRKDRVLKTMMQQEQQQDETTAEELYSQAAFRVVRLNGLLYQGDNAVACTREIARQIGEMARQERKRKRRMLRQLGRRGNKKKREKQQNGMSTPVKKQRGLDGNNATPTVNASVTTPNPLSSPTPDTPGNDAHDFRSRRTGFNTNIALLDEALRTARVDGIPILIVLEELDTFLAKGRSTNFNNLAESVDAGGNQDGGSNDRQLLLYHLLDRVADHKFLVSLVGITTDLHTVNKFEKRVQSRAEGTSKIIYFGKKYDYDELVQSLVGKFYTPPCNDVGKSAAKDDYTEKDAMLEIRNEAQSILLGGDNFNSNEDDINDYSLVRRVLERNYDIKDSDVRWFCRVFDVALSLLASDIEESKYYYLQSLNDSKVVNSNVTKSLDHVAKLTPNHVALALNTMGAAICDVVKTRRPGIPSSDSLLLVKWGQLLGDPTHYSTLVGNDPRLRALLDLSGPQVSILLAARRIIARDDTRANAEDEVDAARMKGKKGSGTVTTMVAPLTYQRIHDEYTTSFVRSGRYTISSDRYPSHVLHRACVDLIEMDLVRFRKEHSGGGTLQYDHSDILSTGTNIASIPLCVNLEWDVEFMGLLRANLLNCSTALREWGLKMN